MSDVVISERRGGGSRGLPGILMNTLPKSGSVYTLNAISVGLTLPRRWISLGTYPDDIIVLDHLVRLLAPGGAVAHEHLPATEYNLRLLGRHLHRVVVHVRDPRMSALEFVHHYSTLEDQVDRQIYDMMMLAPPRDYFSSWSMTERVGWVVDNVLPANIRWIEGWLDAAEDPSPELKILFTRYEDLVKDEDAFFASILDFYGIDKSLWTFKPFTPKAHPDPQREGEYHFRNKRVDEWRDVFTPEQAEKARRMMPERLLERFAWPAR